VAGGEDAALAIAVPDRFPVHSVRGLPHACHGLRWPSSRLPIHGESTVTTGSSNITVNGRRAACVGDQLSWGSVITTGSSSTSGGRGIAYAGCHTSHDGVLSEGDESWQVAP